MSGDLPKIPKYKLARQADSEQSPEPQTTDDAKVASKTETEEPKKRPLELRQVNERVIEDEPMESTTDMLDDAYGAETQARNRSERIALLNKLSVVVTLILLFIVGTLGYAHAYEKWSILTPTSWYLPFLLAAALSAWLCLKSIHFWEDRNKSLALFGALLTAALSYWNLFVLEYVTQGDRIMPSNGLWAPTDINDLYIISEINALRGTQKNKGAYTHLPEKSYYKAFNSIPVEQWQPYFKRYLSNSEMKQVKPINIQNYMHLVAARIHEQRVSTWDALNEQLTQPEFKFQIRQVLLKPYIWLINLL